MSKNDRQHPAAVSKASSMSFVDRLGHFVMDPMGSVIAASVATISTFGIVLSGMWFISAAMN